MLFFTMCALLFCMGLILIRVMSGSTIYDRILAANLFGTNAVIFIVVVGVINDSPLLIDISLVYTCINFISTIAFMRFFIYGTFGDLDL